MSGALAGLAGVLLCWQTATGAPTEDAGWELSAIAAVVIGGTLLTGGVGSVGTALVGVVLLGHLHPHLRERQGRDRPQQLLADGDPGVILLAVVLVQNRLSRRLAAG